MIVGYWFFSLIVRSAAMVIMMMTALWTSSEVHLRVRTGRREVGVCPFAGWW